MFAHLSVHSQNKLLAIQGFSADSKAIITKTISYWQKSRNKEQRTRIEGIYRQTYTTIAVWLCTQGPKNMMEKRPLINKCARKHDYPHVED